MGVIKCVSDGKTRVAEKMRTLNRNTRLVFDYLRMTKNSTRTCPPSLGLEQIHRGLDNATSCRNNACYGIFRSRFGGCLELGRLGVR